MVNMEKEMERIENNFESKESFLLWNAFVRFPHIVKFWDDETTVHFCQDAYTILEGHDDLYIIDDEHLFEDSVDWLMGNYKELLQKYDYPENSMNEAIEKMLFSYFAGWPSICDDIAEYNGYNGDDAEIDDEDQWNSVIAAVIIVMKPKDEGKRLLAEYGIHDEAMHSKAAYWFASQIVADFEANPIPNESGRKAYQDILDLNLLIWLAVVMGEDLSVIREAVQEANKESNALRKCNCFRKTFPFDRFRELVAVREEEYEAAHPELADDVQDEE